MVVGSFYITKMYLCDIIFGDEWPMSTDRIYAHFSQCIQGYISPFSWLDS